MLVPSLGGQQEKTGAGLRRPELNRGPFENLCASLQWAVSTVSANGSFGDQKLGISCGHVGGSPGFRVEREHDFGCAGQKGNGILDGNTIVSGSLPSSVVS